MAVQGWEYVYKKHSHMYCKLGLEIVRSGFQQFEVYLLSIVNVSIKLTAIVTVISFINNLFSRVPNNSSNNLKAHYRFKTSQWINYKLLIEKQFKKFIKRMIFCIISYTW